MLGKEKPRSETSINPPNLGQIEFIKFVDPLPDNIKS